MFPIAYIFTEQHESKLYEKLSSMAQVQSVQILNYKTSSNTDPDVLRMSAICNHHFKDNFKNLLIVRPCPKSSASYASLIANKRVHILFVENNEDYELAKILYLKLIEVNSYNNYIKASKQFYKLLNIYKDKSYIPDLLNADSTLHAQKQVNSRLAEQQISGTIKSRYIDSIHSSAEGIE